MATMTLEEPGGTREFLVPLTDGLPRGPFKTGSAELVIRTAPPGDRPAAVELRCRPTDFEFQVWLPRLVKIFALPFDEFQIGRNLGKGRPVLVFEGKPAVLARVPAGLSDLPALEAFLGTGPNLFDLGEYGLTSIDFESGVAAS